MTPKYREIGRSTIEPRNEKLRLYFLGQLSETESDLFEEEIAQDEGFFEEAQVAERELIDGYVRNNLSNPDREAFDALYLHGEDRREKVAAAESLWRVVNEQQTKEFAAAHRTAPTLWEIFSGWQAIVGFAAILFFVGLVYVGLRSGVKIEVGSGRNANQPLFGISETREAPENDNASVASVGDNSNPQPDGNTTKDKTREPTRLPVADSPVIASFTLLPGALRDEGEQSIKIARNAKSISLRLSPTKDAPRYGIYSVTLKTADGETVFSAKNLKSLSFSLPGDKLENRTYVIFLEGINASNSPEPVAEYTFRVRR